jgi:DNA-binding response OmpR family regulator
VSAHILIVDDEPSLVQGLTYALTREGYVVSVAVDGESAVETALATDFDLIILDLMLPGLSGTEACVRSARRGTCRSSCSPRSIPSVTS